MVCGCGCAEGKCTCKPGCDCGCNHKKGGADWAGKKMKKSVPLDRAWAVLKQPSPDFVQAANAPGQQSILSNQFHSALPPQQPLNPMQMQPPGPTGPPPSMRDRLLAAKARKSATGRQKMGNTRG